METVSYPLRIPQEILAVAKLRAKEEYLDQSTVMRQFLYLGAEEYLLHLVESDRPLTDADFFAHVETVMPLVRAISRNEYNPKRFGKNV